jgi:phosphopantothenoylcysteine decarboxylase
VVYVIGGAAPPIFDIEQLLQLLRRRGWQPCLILTPTAASWVRASHMSEIADCPVRVERRQPGEEDSLPRADAVLVAPLTFNTANKWAAGINDTLALGILNELLGEDIPIVAVPCVKETLGKHPAYINSCARLAQCEVKVLHSQKMAARGPDRGTFDWTPVINELESSYTH